MPQANEFHFFYLLFLPISWIAMRTGLAGAALGLCLIHLLLVAFISWGNPVARDSSGTLWSRVWTHRGTAIDAWRAVEYGGASSQRVFEPVPARMGSPREALEWLLGPSSPGRAGCR